jgi:hypothetical protein
MEQTVPYDRCGRCDRDLHDVGQYRVGDGVVKTVL